MNETTHTLARLQALIDSSEHTAGPALRRNFSGPGWSMPAAEFVAFWQGERMATVSTVSAGGAVHAVPMIPELVDGKFYLPTFPDSVRRQDHAANARCAITLWEDAYRAVIVYGTAREVPAIPAGDEDRRHQPGSLVTIEVTPHPHLRHPST